MILPDYWKIANYHARMGINSEDYWLMSSTDHALEKLPKIFPKEINVQIHEWFGHRPQMHPPHVRDFVNPKMMFSIEVTRIVRMMGF